MLPRKQVSILAGASGVGKTTLTLQAIQAHQISQPFPLNFNATSIGYVVGDRTKDEVTKRAESLGIDMEIYGIVDDTSFKLEWFKYPETAVHAVLQRFKQKHDLLVFDPLALFIGGNIIDYVKVATGMTWLNRFAIKHNLTILALHHASKARTDYSYLRPQDGILGSTALQGFSGDQMILLAEGKQCKFYIVSHTAPNIEVDLIMDGGWFQIVKPEDKLLGEVEGEITTAGLLGIARGLGISPATLYRRLEAYIRQGILVKSGHGRYLKGSVES